MKKKKNKYFVRRPTMRDGEYVVVVAEDRSPQSKVIETVPCGRSRESAFQAYRQIMKEVAGWL